MAEIRGASGVVGGVQGTPSSANYATAAQSLANRPSALDTLLKIGSQVLEPHLKELQAENFNKGMQMVQNGLTMQDVKQNQPAFLKVLGNSDVVSGARAYAGAAQSSMFRHELMRDMPELAKLSPDEYRKEVVRRQQGMLTGDSLTDTVVQQGFLEFAPQMYDVHLRGHIKYQGEQMHLAQTTNRDNSLETYRLLTNTTEFQGMSDDLKAQALQTTAESLLPLDGQPIDMWEKDLGDTVEARLASGDYTIVSVLSQSGLIKNLPKATQAKLINSAMDSTEKTMARYHRDILVDNARITAGIRSGDYSEEEGLRRMIDNEAELQRRTGGYGTVFLKGDDLVGGVVKPASDYAIRMQEREQRMQDSLAIEGAKAAAQADMGARKAEQTLTALRTGQLDGHSPEDLQGGLSVLIGGIDPKTGNPMNVLDPNNTHAAAILVNQYKMNQLVHGVTRNQLSMYDGNTRDLPTTPDDHFIAMSRLYSDMRKESFGISATEAYFGKNGSDFLNIYQEAVTGGMSPQAAYNRALLSKSGNLPQRTAPAKENKSVTNDAVRKTFGRRNWYGGMKLNDATTDYISGIVNHQTETAMKTSSLTRELETERQAQLLWTKAVAHGGTVVMGEGVRKTITGLTTEPVFTEAIAGLVEKKVGYKTKNAMVYYDDRTKQYTVLQTVNDKDDSVHGIGSMIPASQVKSEIERLLKSKSDKAYNAPRVVNTKVYPELQSDRHFR